ncbi:hypothetical protein PFDG_05319 [Plasmodium falciparum Dd2]|uniref:Uncharacterized protein n=1 Tax=Plasmodium falciparum (isolate Dd2) TaxID=57267 RepID=A0A0L7MAA9_PLAF4|nr:hypothetical protein PFDG_05319 [Plasmodium falciparum Dd2]
MNSFSDINEKDIEENTYEISKKKKFNHIDKITLYEKTIKNTLENDNSDDVKINKISKKTFMCLMYNIGIQIDYCLTLWGNFALF